MSISITQKLYLVSHKDDYILYGEFVDIIYLSEERAREYIRSMVRSDKEAMPNRVWTIRAMYLHDSTGKEFIFNGHSRHI